MRPVGFGVIGAGVIGRIHARNIAAHGAAELRWIVDVDARGEALARTHDARFARELAPMLADPDVEVVVVGSSTDVHEAHVLACVEAGKALLCEKPISDSLAGARRCLDAVRRAGTIAAVGFNRRFDTHHRHVYDQVRAGTIGRVEMLHFVSRSPQDMEPAAAARAGGMLRDKGSHHYDLACWLANAEPVEVYGSGACLIDPRHADYADVDTAAIVLRFASGALATFAFNRRTGYGNDEMFEVNGARGMLCSQRQHPLGVTYYGAEGVVVPGLHAGWYERFAPTYAAELDALVTAVRGGANATPGLADGMRAQAIAEAAVESVARGRPVPIANTWSVA
ncbi:MAG: Gfo/Idh/MocA family oxidoreductase [Burkholderiales bacterium]|nr:Gfo/Idh/MocA family oxidoreductase [Burkholderiales bacterium]